MICDKDNELGDFLFRLVVSNCENIAISPEWWEQLDESQKEQIISKVSSMSDSFSMTEPIYLMRGLEGICNWDFKVISKME